MPTINVKNINKEVKPATLKKPPLHMFLSLLLLHNYIVIPLFISHKAQ